MFLLMIQIYQDLKWLEATSKWFVSLLTLHIRSDLHLMQLFKHWGLDIKNMKQERNNWRKVISYAFLNETNIYGNLMSPNNVEGKDFNQEEQNPQVLD